MNNPTLSVIVSAFNIEKFVGDCLTSLTNQTFKDVEFIVIDDYSSDETFSICRTFMNKDSRFKVFRNTYNQGPLSLRKKALSLANGKYIIFVDGDDYLCTKDSLRDLIKQVENVNSDIYRFKVTVSGVNDHVKQDLLHTLNQKHPNRISSIDILKDYFIHNTNPYCLWCNCFKTSVVKTAFQHIPNDYLVSCEDGYASFIIAFFSKTYVQIDTPPIYTYRIGSGISTSPITIDKFKKRISEYNCIQLIRKFLVEQEATEEYYTCLNHMEKTLARNHVLYISQLKTFSEAKQLIESSKDIPHSPAIQKELSLKVLELERNLDKLKSKRISARYKRLRALIKNIFTS